MNVKLTIEFDADALKALVNDHLLDVPTPVPGHFVLRASGYSCSIKADFVPGEDFFEEELPPQISTE